LVKYEIELTLCKFITSVMEQKNLFFTEQGFKLVTETFSY